MTITANGRRFGALATVAALTLGFGMATATPAAAEPVEPVSSALSATPAIGTEAGPLLTDLRAAADETERVALLEDAGFLAVGTSSVYQASADGLTVSIDAADTAPAPGTVTPQASIGWNGGPYLQMTYNEAVSAARYGLAAGTGACALITSLWGAAACGSASAVIGEFLSDAEIPGGGDALCIGIRPIGVPTDTAPSQVWLEGCS